MERRVKEKLGWNENELNTHVKVFERLNPWMVFYVYGMYLTREIVLLLFIIYLFTFI